MNPIRDAILKFLREQLKNALLKQFIVSLIKKALALTGPAGFVAGIIIPKLVQWELFAMDDFIEKTQDKVIRDDYKKEMSKGKDADEKKKLDSQSDILNGPN